MSAAGSAPARYAGPMRTSGLVEDTRGLGAHDHVCWAYDTPEEFVRPARAFLAEGLADGMRVWLVASGTNSDLRAHLAGIDGIDDALRTGAARVVPLDATYPVGAVVDPVAQTRAYAEATRDAVSAGYEGLRVAADCTPLVSTPEQLAAFARYEHMVDHHMAARPFSALCAYRRSVLGDAAVAQLACMHPAANSSADPGFRLFGSVGHAAALSGEVDIATDELFAVALRRASPSTTADELVLDAGELRFLDHRGLQHLADHAERHDTTVVLRTPWPGAARLVELLGTSRVRVEAAA